MKFFPISLCAGSAVALFALAPLAALHAQDETPVAVAGPAHGDWTLKEREEWLHSRLDKARDGGDLDHHEYDRVKHDLDRIHETEEAMRDHHDGQLTDNQTADLEARLDDVAAKIHWAHENSFQRPW
ncbi:MAG: hypothetical protein ABI306_02415 [Caulobacteraceae bacterium]